MRVRLPKLLVQALYRYAGKCTAMEDAWYAKLLLMHNTERGHILFVKFVNSAIVI